MRKRHSIQRSSSGNYQSFLKHCSLAAVIAASSLACSGVPEDSAEFEEELGSVEEALIPVAPGTRRTIQSLSAADRKALADGILAFITRAILDEHANAHDWHHPSVGELFFSRHHDYLNKLETYLLANNLSRFVPLPSWNPGTSIPSEFMVLDPLVSGAMNQNPNRPPPARLQNVCVDPYADVNTLAVSTESWHDGVHGAVGGAMGSINSAPGAPIFWLWHAFLDDMYHTYQACMTPRADLVTEIAPGDGHWGTWRPTAYCPAGQYAVAYKMRVEGNQGSGDDSSMNGVQLECRSPNGGTPWWVSSSNGSWGGWTGTASCKNADPARPTNFLDGARMRIEARQGSGDDTAANDATFTCSQGDVINPGGGRGIGSWTTDAVCPTNTAVCGITTRVESNQGSGDDTGLNGIRLKCCQVQPTIAACSTPIDESWTSTLGSEGSSFTGDWGDPLVDTATRRLRLSHDDVVTRRGNVPGSYYVTHKLNLSGGTVFTPYTYVDGVQLPSIRRSGSDMQLGGDRYGGSWSSTEPAGFGGRLLTGLLNAKVTSYMQASSKRMAMKVEAGGATYRSGWTALTWPETNPSMFRLIGQNNSSIYTGTDDYVWVGRLGGCGNLTDANVEALYNQ